MKLTTRPPRHRRHSKEITLNIFFNPVHVIAYILGARGNSRAIASPIFRISFTMIPPSGEDNRALYLLTEFILRYRIREPERAIIL